jgi:AraC-like DNA-binding protein
VDKLGETQADSVSDALRSLSVRSTVFCTSELRAPWGFCVERSTAAKFHLVLAGSCCLRLDERGPIQLTAGNLVLLPRGDAHYLSDGTDSPQVSLSELLREMPPEDDLTLRIDGDGPLTRLLCGGFVLGTDLPPTVAESYPRLLQIDAATLAVSAWLEPALLTLATQTAEGIPGAHAMQAKIAEVFIAEALRSWLIDAHRAGVLIEGLVSDEPIAQALAAMRQRFDEPWTLSTLAVHVGLSRTALTMRFRQLVDDSPMHYLTRIRLSRAAGLLATTRLSHYEIARLSGYATEAALAKAFKRERGETLGEHRAAARGEPQIRIVGSAT